MSDYTKYTKQEMQAYAIAKNIKENQIVIVGTGLPLIGASLRISMKLKNYFLALAALAASAEALRAADLAANF